MKRRTRKPRRPAEEARREILDAAERRLVEEGPSALRLQDVAADIGSSHPAVLHHFGSREGLVQAVIDRAVHALQADLVESISTTADAGHIPDGAELIERVYETLSERGHARLIAWLLLSGFEPIDTPDARGAWAMISEATHALRLAKGRGKKKPTLEDTRFTIALSALVVFSFSIAGSSTLRVAGFPDDPKTQKRFRQWFASLLARHLADPS
jgi:AcrR family transcriptional regulator